ncbi:MSHA biogenesis protein MshF [Shewanella sp.]|uniref:MSHA biogenesis protein MshF n=1 Tax=Shewanella sp. TaxID=50422 RepID=UPI003F2D7B9C
MSIQQHADSQLLRLYGRMACVIVLLLMMVVIGSRYFASIPPLGAKGLAFAHPRFLHVLTMVRSQWLSQGQPSQLQLQWAPLAPTGGNTQTMIRLNARGWPQSPRGNPQACQVLWQQLMGAESSRAHLIATYLPQDNSCRYRAENGDSLVYQQDFGRVIFLTN